MIQLSQFRPISKLDQLAENIIQMAFNISEDYHVIQGYNKNKKANFRILNNVGESEINI
ncbi:hypothetical protein FHS59_004043 [Algoriphagus iocasae]|uniref:Uncharacterized protein n=1 Tax=Algoriphagus iocasae TaxID=1836499 RepID=A0A841MLR4_9BACT|nr:hypothetical protein [Algoriphagus iocasae]